MVIVCYITVNAPQKLPLNTITKHSEFMYNLWCSLISKIKVIFKLCCFSIYTELV